MFTIRPSTTQDFPRIVAIINSQTTEPQTLEDFERGDRNRPATDIFHRLVAESPAGEVIAFGAVNHEGSHHEGEFFIRVRVDAPYQGKGVGTALLERLEQFTREHGGTKFETGVREQDTLAVDWCLRKGFKSYNILRESTRTLDDWDPAPFQEAVARVQAQGFRFATLAQEMEGQDYMSMMRRYFEALLPMVRDIPGNEDRPKIPFEEWFTYVKDDPGWKPERCLLAIDTATGAWAAISNIYLRSNGALYNDFTGVARQYRGRGLTLGLKVESLTLAKRLGGPYIRTNNLANNPRILAVNQRLGYVSAPGHHLLEKQLV